MSGRTPPHVVFGTGAIGLALARSLVARGEAVRMVNRSGSARAPEGVEVVGGDAKDPAFSTSVTAGARVVYQVLNPPYAQWSTEFPALQAAVLAGAEAAGARLVSMDNVYTYGRPDGRALTEASPNNAHTGKGRLRGRMADELFAAHRSGRVEVAIGRASDYFGPGGGAQSNIGDRVMPPALAGRAASVLGDPDQPHTYSYIPDIGAGLAALGERDGVTGEIWHLPNDPDTRSTRSLVESVFTLAGHPGGKVRAVPALVLRAVGVFNPTVRAVLEMQYLFQEPFVVDSSKITERLGLHATPLDQALEETLATYRSA